jgi:hypothetical protein
VMYCAASRNVTKGFRPGKLIGQSIHKPKPEAGLDVRQTVGRQSG